MPESTFLDKLNELTIPNHEYTEVEKAILRPIAETLAMIDGQAYFGQDDIPWNHYENYLGGAWLLFEANGGLRGNAGKASWIKNISIHKMWYEKTYPFYRDCISESFKALGLTILWGVPFLIILSLLVNFF